MISQTMQHGQKKLTQNMNIVYMYVYINMYIPEEGSVEMHTKLLIIIPGVREVQDNFHYMCFPQPPNLRNVLINT